MSRIKLILKTIGLSAVVLSGCITPATAQTIDKPLKKYNARALTSTKPQKLYHNLLVTKSQEELHQEQPKISIGQDINTSSSLEISQATETNQLTETDTYSEFER